jgi:hypothetical protein
MSILNFIAGLFLGKNFRSAVRELDKMKKEGPELKEGLDNFYSNYKAIKKDYDDICAKYPHLPNCKNRN